MAEYKIGDELLHYGETDAYFTEGEIYVVDYVGRNVVSVVDDDGDDHSMSFGFIPKYFTRESREATEPQPDVHALIANLGRRLHEVETTLAPKLDVADKPAQIRSVCDKVRDLLIRKNHDYGDSFAQQYEKYGLQSALIRMDDKMRRLETLADGEQAQVAESIEDTLMDLAGYALLALVEAGESE